MSSKMSCVVLVSVLGVSVMSGCRSNKSAFSYASPPPSTASYASYASVEPQSNAASPPLPVMTPPAAAADTYSPPAGSAYAPSNYSPAPSKSSSGCSSGCCSG